VITVSIFDSRPAGFAGPCREKAAAMQSSRKRAGFRRWSGGFFGSVDEEFHKSGFTWFDLVLPSLTWFDLV
jgi:hypothetical protein